MTIHKHDMALKQLFSLRDSLRVLGLRALFCLMPGGAANEASALSVTATFTKIVATKSARTVVTTK
jgi:hypothetical protein